jgi:hypothetical protein
MDPTVAQALAGYAQRPARPVTPTPDQQMPPDLNLPTPMSQSDLMDALYGSGADPLPSWLPQNVQSYMNKTPAYAEGERRRMPDIAGGEPYSPTPQIDDVRRLFQNRINQNGPSGDLSSIRAQQFRELMKLPGFSGFTGGDNI